MSILFYAAPGGVDWDSFTGDDFTSTNGDPLNTDYWEDSELQFSWEIQNNKCNQDTASGDVGFFHSLSKFRIQGDYSVQIDFDSFSSSPVTGSVYWRMLITNIASSYSTYIQVGGNNTFGSNYNINSVWQGSTTSPRSNDFGKLRVTRTGSEVYTSYQDGAGGWTAKDNATLNTDDMVILLAGETVNGVAVSGNFDNFLINSGTVSEF